MGSPSLVMRPVSSRWKRICSFSREKGSVLLRISRREITTLTAWAPTVAIAAPTVPRWKPATRIRSPTILHTQAMATVIRGVTESPIPRKMLPIRL